MRASIRVRDEDTDEVITLRIWHELLHAVGQPADDMVILATDWQTPLERILWHIWRIFGGYPALAVSILRMAHGTS